MSDSAEVYNSEKSDNGKITENGKAQAEPQSPVPRWMCAKGATISPVSFETAAGEKSTVKGGVKLDRWGGVKVDQRGR